MATKKKANPAVEAMPRYIPQQQFEWREYRRPDAPDDAPPLLVQMRSQLTSREVETFVFEAGAKTTEVWDAVAPFVVAWNLYDVDGEPMPPPSEGGGGQFDYLNNGLFWEIFNDLKFRSGAGVTSDFLLRSKPSDANAVSSSDA